MAGEDPGAYRDQHDAIRKEFARQAPGWGKSGVSDRVLWAVDLLDLRADFAVLDVAAGTGLLSRAIAPRVKRVVASDITPEMLAEGRAAADREGITNITFERAAAEDLPYPTASFDAVITRFSVHHFRSPEAVLREMSRVCRPGAKVLVADLVSPEDEDLAARYNELERLRDHTHTRALPPSELKRLLEGAGVRVTGYYSREVEMKLDDWLDATRPGPQERRKVLEAIDQDLKGSARTGFRPFLREGKTMFVHTWGAVVGEKK